MTEFKGARAALQAFQFIVKHLGFFLNLVGTWTVIMVLLDVVLCFLLHPAGDGASLTDNLIKLNEGGVGSGAGFLRLLGTALGNIVIGVNWIQFAVLDHEPRNPVRLVPEMGLYFGRSIGVGLIAGASAIPGVIVAVALGSIWPSAVGRVIAVVAGVAAAALPAHVNYRRLNLALASAALGDDTVGISRAFELTKGRSMSCAGGFVLAYLMPLVPLLVVTTAAGALVAAGSRTTGAIILDIATAVSTFSIAAMLAGFQSNMYTAFVPGDHSDKIAKTFE
jgi:hypothetical protein